MEAKEGGPVICSKLSHSQRSRLLRGVAFVSALLASFFLFCPSASGEPVSVDKAKELVTRWAQRYIQPLGTGLGRVGKVQTFKDGATVLYHVVCMDPDGFVTTYSHMSALARGLEPGAHVRLGQTIGALGQSGLATGPHLHFEVKLNGAFVNPLTVRVPRASHLDGVAMEQFRHDRGQVDRVLACSEHGACQGPA